LLFLRIIQGALKLTTDCPFPSIWGASSVSCRPRVNSSALLNVRATGLFRVRLSNPSLIRPASGRLVTSIWPVMPIVRLPPCIVVIRPDAYTAPCKVGIPLEVRERLPGLLAVLYVVSRPPDSTVLVTTSDPDISIVEPGASVRTLPWLAADKVTFPPLKV